MEKELELDSTVSSNTSDFYEQLKKLDPKIRLQVLENLRNAQNTKAKSTAQPKPDEMSAADKFKLAKQKFSMQRNTNFAKIKLQEKYVKKLEEQKEKENNITANVNSNTENKN